MFAGIMSGINAQRKENTSNRRESTKLFNDYLAKTRELGLDLTEEDLTGNWNSNASRVNRKYAPTRDRMKSIIEANTNYNDRVAAKQSFDDLVQSQKVDEMVEQMVKKGFNENIYSEDSSELNDSMLAQFGDNQMLIDSYNLRYKNGMGLSAAHKAYESSQIIDAFDKIERLNKGGVFDPKEIQGFLPDVPPHIIAAATEKAKTSYDQSQQVFEEQRFAVQIGNRNAAMAEISTKVKLGDVTPENVKLIMERYKVTDPEQQQMVLDHYQLESKKMSQAGMETYNTQVDTRTAKSNQDIAKTIASTKKNNTDNIGNFTNGLDPNIRGAVVTLANKYIINVDNINDLKTYILDQPNLANLNPTGIVNQIEDYLKNSQYQTYSNLQSQYENQAVEAIGSKQYTPESFEQGYLGDLEYEGSSYLTRLQRASDSGNYPAFMQAQASLSAVLEKIIHDLSNRRVNPQKSFGPYASEEEIQRVMALAYTAITNLQTEAAKISAPEDTRSNLSQAMQNLIEENEQKILALKSGTSSNPMMGGTNTAMPFPLSPSSPEVIDEIARLQAEIDNAMKGQ
jgi:hypothetical protein